MAENKVGVHLTVDNRAGFQRDMGLAATSVDRFGDQTARAGSAAQGTGRRVGALGRIGMATGGLLRTGLIATLHALRYALFAAAGGAAYLAHNSIQAAGDLGESVNKASVTFGKSRAVILKWAKTTARALGTSRRTALEAGSGYGQILKASGLTEKASALMSRRMVTLAADMASFHNLDTATALDKIRAGLVGEAEPLRQVGVLLSEARVQEEAYRAGIARRGEELTDAQKVQARYNLILKDTNDTHGDFARTSGSMANQQRILSARFEDLSAKLGKKLLPYALKIVTWANKTLPGAFKAAEGAIGAITENWDAMVSTFGVGIGWVLGAFRRWGDFMLKWAGTVIDAFALSFGWLPKIGPQIEVAQEKFHTFQRSIINDLRTQEIRFKNWDIGITQALRHASSEYRSFTRTVNKGPGQSSMAPFSFVPPSQRATGGPVSTRHPYLVGERGPELFRPSTSGTIEPNHSLDGGGDIFNLYGDIYTEARSAQELFDDLKKVGKKKKARL
jgi:hypothetical protein